MEVKKTNYLETLMNFAKTMIGAGVFSVGVGFKYAGLLAAIVITTVEAGMIAHCVHLLAEALDFASEIADKEALENEVPKQIVEGEVSGEHVMVKETPEVSFARMAKLIIQTGPCTYAHKLATVISEIIETLISIQYTGGSSLYLVFVGKAMHRLVSSFGHDMNVRICIFIVWVPMSLLSFIPNLKGLAKVSFIGNIMVLLTYFIAIYYLFDKLTASDHKIDVKYIGSITEMPILFGILLFAFEIVAVIFPLRVEMKDPKQLRARFGIINIGFLLSFILNMLMGIISYLAYGDSLSDTILIDLPSKEVAARIAFIAVSLEIVMSYPICLYVPYKIIFEVLERKRGPFKREYLWKTCIRLFLICCSQIAAQAIPHIDLLLSILGCVCCTWLTLFLGPLFSIIINYPKYEKLKKKLFLTKNIVIMIFSQIFFVSGFGFCLFSLIKIIKNDLE